MVKSDRHRKIIELVKNEIIETQEDLTARLKQNGFDVTQATVSRDIKALKLIKVAYNDEKNARSGYKYAIHGVGDGNQELDVKFRNLLRDVIVSADFAGNLAVFKTYAGMANAAAAAIDATHNSSIVGSVAGDDTVLCVLRTEKKADEFVELIRRSIGE